MDVTPQIDDSHQLVNVNFVVIMGKQARIARVTVLGPADPEQLFLVSKTRSFRARFTGGLLKPGKPYTPERIKAATKLIKRSLAQQHRLASKVNEMPPQYHAETNRVDVSFKVEPGPVVLIPVYSEGTIDSDLIQEGQNNLV